MLKPYLRLILTGSISMGLGGLATNVRIRGGSTLRKANVAYEASCG